MRNSSIRGFTLLNVLMVAVLIIALAAASSKIVAHINNSEKQSRLTQSFLALQGNLTILLNSPSSYKNCIAATSKCEINGPVYAAVSGSSGDPKIDILYRRILPFAECPGAAPCGLRSTITSPTVGNPATSITVQIIYEGTDFPMKPRVFTVQIPEFAYKLATNSCSASEFFAGIDAAGAPVCSHFFNNCPSGRFFAGFLPPAGGATAYSSDPQLNCVATKPASPPSSACPMGTVGITQSGGPTGIYIKCILASSTTVACPATTQVASGMSWDLNNRFAPILTCISRKGL